MLYISLLFYLNFARRETSNPKALSISYHTNEKGPLITRAFGLDFIRKQRLSH